jgi:glycosyltransferase involved in cell wall biosynthesis
MPSLLHILPHPGGGGEVLVDYIEELAYDHDRVWLSGSAHPRDAMRSLPTTWPRVARMVERCDVVHIVGDAAALLVLPLLRRRPAVVSTCGLALLRRTRGRRAGHAVQLGMRRVAGRAARIACSSRPELSELAEVVDPVAASRLTVVPNGIDVPPLPDPVVRREVRAELGLADDEVAALFLGTLGIYKDPLTVVRAAVDVRERGTRFVLLVAGAGDLMPELERHAGPAVRILGFRRDTDRLMAAADIFTLPSLREGHSFALLEAMSHGLPAIVSNGLGNPETVGAAGIVVEIGNAPAFSSAFAALAHNPQERERLGRLGRARVAEEFTRQRMLGQMREVFEEALAHTVGVRVGGAGLR